MVSGSKVIAGSGNLSLVSAQKQNLQGMAGRTNFSLKVPVPLLFMMLKLQNLRNFNQVYS